MLSNDINLLIFNLDGTLIDSNQANYEALKKALTRLNLKLPINNPEEMKLFMGRPTEDVYKYILSEEKFSQWKEIREEVK
jgi:phosphoglycolate phosphatase-like HAD superfamily hydrolase